MRSRNQMLHFSDSSGKDLGFSPDELNNVNLRDYHRVPGKFKILFKAYPHFDYTIPKRYTEIIKPIFWYKYYNILLVIYILHMVNVFYQTEILFYRVCIVSYQLFDNSIEALIMFHTSRSITSACFFPYTFSFRSF